MTGPWEDFQAPSTEGSGPWEDFKAPVEKPAEVPSLWDAVKGAFTQERNGRMSVADAMGGAFTTMGQGVPVAGALVPETEASARYKQERPIGATLMQVGGGLAGSAPLMAAAPEAFGMGAAQSGMSRIGASILSSGGMSAADTATRDAMRPQTGQPMTDAGAMLDALGLHRTGNRTLDSALESAALSGASTTAGGAAGHVLQGVTNPDVQYLARHGVTMPPTMVMGAHRLGDAMESIPFSGQSAARGRALEDFNKAAHNQTLSYLQHPMFEQAGIPSEFPQTLGPNMPRGTGMQVGQPLDTGEVGRQWLYEASQQAYRSALQGTSFQMTPQLGQNVYQTILGAHGRGAISDATAERLARMADSMIFERINNVTPGQPLTGKVWKEIDSDLGHRADAAFKGGGGENYEEGLAIGQIRRATRAEFEAQNPNNAEAIRQVDRMYGSYTTETRAGANLGTTHDQSHNFTPAQLLAASRTNDPSLYHRAFSQGQGNLQRLAQAGQNVMGRAIGNSGTSERSMLAGTLLTGELARFNPWVSIPAIGAMNALNSPVGSRIFQSAAVGPWGGIRQPLVQGARSIPQVPAQVLGRLAATHAALGEPQQ